MKLRWPVARVVLIVLILVGAVMVGIGVKALVDGRRFIASAVVLYDPADPQHAVLDTWDDVWKMGVVFVSVGLLLMAFNAVMYLLVRSGRVTLWLTGTRQ
jgi:hypothetical protein